ncbi:hypothetical protein SPRG_04904 [Saprolegnia parasitica CBS 223.65]|uniref:Uncharacterized protein n=1 Tax=Saprolegnia parasitica (strain CBS 223.65) TaxID=695850 RepID=A0A067CGB8_SAPPC|nr:hypothetical protein SPRG_04904 [Saprolegnia parasitica CBS 223.65]KDO29789.1 hypothetical protein SPRG_04904 [Saprolegnia parasitica CBS 223.65]|eukprot:XP_012199434.1 hypothetical protein SPRG_04904 [Saprolegnia parasitica CBS 223.65]
MVQGNQPSSTVISDFEFNAALRRELSLGEWGPLRDGFLRAQLTPNDQVLSEAVKAARFEKDRRALAAARAKEGAAAKTAWLKKDRLVHAATRKTKTRKQRGSPRSETTAPPLWSRKMSPPKMRARKARGSAKEVQPAKAARKESDRKGHASARANEDEAAKTARLKKEQSAPLRLRARMPYKKRTSGSARPFSSSQDW